MVDLAKLRERLGGISQSELARRIGVAQSTIWRIETGKMDQRGPIAVLLEKLDDETPRTAPKRARVAA